MSMKIIRTVPSIVRMLVLAIVSIAVLGGSANICVIGDNSAEDARSWELTLDKVTHAFSYSVQWSPDGEYVVFTNRGGIHSGVTYVAAYDGSSLNRITRLHPTGEFVDLHPDVSPDGTRIVYSTSRHKTNNERNFEIETSKLDGSDKQRLTETLSEEIFPVWSPSGSHIAFSRVDKGLFVMDADGSNERLITENTPQRGLAWSPDGQTLAFVSYRSIRPPDKMRAIGRQHLYTVRTDGSDPTIIFSSYDQYLDRISAPAWLSDGSRVAFSHNIDPKFRTLIQHSPDKYFTDFPEDTKPGLTLYTVDPDGINLFQVMTVSAEPFTLGETGEKVEWSPDGSVILMSPAGMLVNVDGSELRELPVRVRRWGWGAWSPDDSEIAILLPSSGSRAVELYIIDQDGVNARLIAKTDSDGEQLKE